MHNVRFKNSNQDHVWLPQIFSLTKAKGEGFKAPYQQKIAISAHIPIELKNLTVPRNLLVTLQYHFGGSIYPKMGFYEIFVVGGTNF